MIRFTPILILAFTLLPSAHAAETCTGSLIEAGGQKMTPGAFCSNRAKSDLAKISIEKPKYRVPEVSKFQLELSQVKSLKQLDQAIGRVGQEPRDQAFARKLGKLGFASEDSQSLTQSFRKSLDAVKKANRTN